MIEIVILSIFFLLLINYLIFLAAVLTGLSNLSDTSVDHASIEFISVIIPFRNEEKNIINSYNSIRNLNYPSDKFEVLYIDDSSDDNSKSILEKSNKMPNIKILSVPKHFSVNAHKKRAVRFGISQCKGQIIVTTDADCVHSENWLQSLLSFMDNETGFVSGPVKYERGQNLFTRVQELEFSGLVITGAGLIGSHKPTICNAANIAYRKSVFDQVNGFNDQMDLSSGDDELLMQKIFSDTEYKIKFAVNRDAVVTTSANSTLGEFFNQRKRWASKGLFYADKFLILKLILIYLFYVGLLTQILFGLIINHVFLLSFFISFIAKLIFEYQILKKGYSKVFHSRITGPFFLTQLFQIPYISISGISGVFGNFIWKDRKIKR